MTLRVKKGESIGLQKIIPLRGLQLQLDYVTFDGSSKTLTIKTKPSRSQIIIPNLMTISGVTINLTVKLTNPLKTLSLEVKGKWRFGNLNIMIRLSYNRGQGDTKIHAFLDKKVSLKNFVKSLTGLSIPGNPRNNIGMKFYGYITAKNVVTLVLTINNGKNKFFAIYQKRGKNAPSVKAIAVDISQVSLSTIIRNVLKLDISSVPFFGSLRVKEIGLTYSTGKMALDKNTFGTSRLLQRNRGLINKGLTAYFKLPFHKEPIKIIYVNKVLLLTTTNLSLKKILYSIAGKRAKHLSLPPGLNSILKLNINQISIAKGRVGISVSYPRRIILFNKILVLSNVQILVTLSNQPPKLSVEIRATMNLAGSTFKTMLAKRRKKYVLTATGDRLNLNKLFQKLHAAILPKVLNVFLKKLPFLKCTIIKPKISYTFGSKPMQMHIGGTPVVHGFKTTYMDSLIVEVGKKTKVVLGFELGVMNFADLLTKVTGFNFRSFFILRQDITTSVMISPVSSTTLHFTGGKLASLSITEGVSVFASMKFPNKCGSDKFCKFGGILLGKNVLLSVKASITSSTYCSAFASVANLRLGKKIILFRAGLKIVGGSSPEIGLVGQIALRKPPLTFSGKISVGSKGLSLQLSVQKCWKNAFGRKWLDICNFLGAIDFVPPTLITGFAFGAEINLGYRSSGHQIKAKGYVGVNTINPSENYYYVKFNKITMGSLLKAFKLTFTIPRALSESGFPKGFLSSFSLSGKELPEFHLSIPSGYRIKGTLNILGLQGMADITMSLPKGIYIQVALPPIKIGSLLRMYASSTDTSRGPFLNAIIKLLPTRYVKIEAKGYLMVLGISRETKLKITNTQYEFRIQGKMLNLYRASLDITAKYGSIRGAQFQVRGEFKSDLFNGIQNIVKRLANNLANFAKRQLEKAKKLVNKFGAKIRKLISKSNYVLNMMKKLQSMKVSYNDESQAANTPGKITIDVHILDCELLRP